MKNTMKKLLTGMLAVCMILAAIPTVFADGSTSYCKIMDIVEGEGDYCYGDEIFILEDVVYNSHGEKVGELNLGENGMVWYVSGSIIVVWNSDDYDANGSESGWYFYHVGEDGLELLYSFNEEEYYVMSYGYENPEYATVMVYSDSSDSLYEKYIIFDNDGKEVYVENGNKHAYYYGGGMFIEYDNETSESSVFVFENGIKNYKTVGGYICGALPGGAVMTQNDDEQYGLRNLNDKVILEEKYHMVDMIGEYYVGYLDIDTESYYPVDGVVVDINGNKIYETERYIEFFNGIISVETDIDYNDYIIDVKAGKVIDSGEYMYSCGDDEVFVIEKLDDEGLLVPGYAVKADGTFLVDKPVSNVSFDSSNGSYAYYDTDEYSYYNHDVSGNVYSYGSHTMYGFEVTTHGIQVIVDNDIKYNIYHRGSFIAGGYEYFDEFFKVSDCQVFVFSNYNDVTEEWVYTYVVLRTSPFSDIVLDFWAYPYVNYCVNSGLMNGTGRGQFSPHMQVSRTQVVTTLWRLAGSPASEGNNKFVDVADGQWYSDAVAWAAETGITTGVGGNYFAPDRAVTRGEVAAIIYRFAEAMGMDISGRSELADFVDTADLSDWNRDAFAWCVDSGIITGKSGASLAPNDTLTRAELATILERY